MKIGLMVITVLLFLAFNPLALLFTWVITSPFVSNYLARPNLNPLFGSYRLVEYAWYAIPGVDIRELFTFDRIVLASLFCVALAKWHSAVRIREFKGLNVTFLLFIAALVVSSILSKNMISAWRIIIDTYGLCYFAFFIGSVMAMEDKPFNKCLKTLVGLGCLLVAVCLVEYARYSGTTPDPVYRMTGPFRYWETLALTQGVVFFVCLYRRNTMSPDQTASRNLYAFLIILVGLCIFMAQTRSIMVTILLGLAFINIKGRIVVGRQATRRFLAVVALLTSIVLLSPIFLGDTVLYQQRMTKRTDEGRMENYWAAAKMFAHNPLIGIGLKNYEGDKFMYADQRDIMEQKITSRGTCHNSYLVAAAETGLLGLVPLVILALFSYKLAKKYYYKAQTKEERMWGLTFGAITVMYYLSAIWFDPFFEPTMDNRLYFMLLGITLARYQKLGDVPTSPDLS